MDIFIEPQRVKTNLLTNASDDDSNHHAYLQSDQSLCCPHEAIQTAPSEDSDQTARMRRLI